MELGNGKARQDHIEEMEGDGAKDMELGEMDVDANEKECDKKRRGHVFRRRIELIQEVIIKTKYCQQLRIAIEPRKRSKRKLLEESYEKMKKDE